MQIRHGSIPHTNIFPITEFHPEAPKSRFANWRIFSTKNCEVTFRIAWFRVRTRQQPVRAGWWPTLIVSSQHASRNFWVETAIDILPSRKSYWSDSNPRSIDQSSPTNRKFVVKMHSRCSHSRVVWIVRFDKPQNLRKSVSTEYNLPHVKNEAHGPTSGGPTRSWTERESSSCQSSPGRMHTFFRLRSWLTSFLHSIVTNLACLALILGYVCKRVLSQSVNCPLSPTCIMD